MAVFDPDTSLGRRWAEAAPHVTFLDEQALVERIERAQTFDLILCSLVLCAVDDAAASEALGRIRRLVSAAGRVLIAVCDPTAHGVRATTYQERLGGGAIPYEGTGAYAKRVEGAVTTRLEHHRSHAAYRRAFARAGLAVASEATVDGVDVERFERVSEFVIFELQPLPPIGPRTTLLVKTCAQEAETIGDQVEHLVRQLGSPRAFDEVVVLVDPHEGPFLRQHHAGDLQLLHQTLAQLIAAGLVDRVIHGPCEPAHASGIAERWFGLRASVAHSENGQPVLGILDALDQVTGDLVFHADADLMVARPDPRFDLIADAVSVFDAEPEAVVLALPVHGDTTPETRAGDQRGPFRVEAVAGWIHRTRLSALRPLPNEARAGRLVLPWHRALDRTVRQGRALSLRRGSPGVWCACPDNARKHSTDLHLLLMDRHEAGYAPPRQAGRMQMVGAPDDWLGPKRREPLVVVLCGRNVPPGRVRRCLDSLAAQRDAAWGAIIIDDASDNGTEEILGRAVAALGPQVTYLRRRRRAGLLANTALAVRTLCTNPDTVIALVDLDDALGTSDALATVLAAHADGADATVGSMVRTDKEISYPVDFTDPRGRRGGNVWQHLRTFRKALFDRVELSDLKLDDAWIDPPSDWAIMVPVIEMASRPVWIRRALYLHEPSGPRSAEARAEREALIGRTLERPSYRSAARAERLRPRELTVLCYHRIADGNAGPLDLYRRRGMVVSRRAFERHMHAIARRFEPITLDDLGAAARNERSLPERPVLVTFDDGYRDLTDTALPILERAGIPAVVFARVPTRGGLPSWAPLDLLYHVLAAVRADEATLAAVLGPAAREALLSIPLAAQIERVLDLARGFGVDATALRREDLYIDEEALRALWATGVAVGAHGVEHVRWTTLPDDLLESAAVSSPSLKSDPPV